jgi:hypothetical protein
MAMKRCEAKAEDYVSVIGQKAVKYNIRYSQNYYPQPIQTSVWQSEKEPSAMTLARRNKILEAM